VCRRWILLAACWPLLLAKHGLAQEGIVKELRQLLGACSPHHGESQAIFRQNFLSAIRSLSNGQPNDATLVDSLASYHLIGRTGEDRSLRPTFSAMQEDVERTIVSQLSNGAIKKAIIIIHAGSVPDPLTVNPIDLANQDPLRVGRPNLLRNLLEQGAQLYAIYPATGGSKRLPAELLCYKATLAKYPSLLVDAPISDTFLPRDQQGSTYLMLAASGQWWLFSIGGTQKLDALEHDQWQVWFAPLCSPEAMARLNTVLGLLNKALANKNSGHVD